MALPGTKRRSTLRPVDHILLALCIGALVAAIVDRLARAGPLSLRYPATVFSNGSPALRPVDRYLVFLAAVRGATPPGATARLVAADAPTRDSWMNFEIAIGQLPRQNVIRADSGARSGSGEFVASYERSLEGLGPPVPTIWIGWSAGRTLITVLTCGFLAIGDNGRVSAVPEFAPHLP